MVGRSGSVGLEMGSSFVRSELSEPRFVEISQINTFQVGTLKTR